MESKRCDLDVFPMPIFPDKRITKAKIYKIAAPHDVSQTLAHQGGLNIFCYVVKFHVVIHLFSGKRDINNQCTIADS